MDTKKLNTSCPVNETGTPQTIIINQSVPEKNGIGVAGFVMSITGLILCWVPIIKWLLLTPAFILSFIGVFRRPRVLAVIGTIISFLVIALLVIAKVSFWNSITTL